MLNLLVWLLYVSTLLSVISMRFLPILTLQFLRSHAKAQVALAIDGHGAPEQMYKVRLITCCTRLQ
jgi:hypothetical protein